MQLYDAVISSELDDAVISLQFRKMMTKEAD